MKLDIITVIKCIAILYISILYTFTGITISSILESFFFPKSLNNIDEKKEVLPLIFEISLIIGTLAISSFVGRNMIQHVPFPLDNYRGFEYLRVQNLSSGLVLSVSLMTCGILTKRVELLKSKLRKH